MAGKEVLVRVTAQDNASNTFRTIGQNAAAMGGQVDQSSTRSAQSMERFSKGAAALGAAIGSATLLMGEWSRAAAEDEASQARVEQAISNTGAALDDYTGKLDAVIKKGQQKAFSDDQTRDALTKLLLATNDTQASMNQLGLVMDFARAKGIDLSTSAEVIGKVMSGNTSILTRYGIILDENATATEALAVIQERSAGQAETYAHTQIGQLDILKDKIGETTEAWGAHAGQLQSLLLMLPGLRAGYVGLAAAIGGVGGLGSVAGLLGPGALIAGAGSLAYGYGQDTLGTTATNKFWNEFFQMGAEVINALTPGSIMSTDKYTNQMATNRDWDAINSVLQTPGMSQEQTVTALAKLLGVQGTTQTIDTGYWKDDKGRINYGAPPPGVSTSTTQYIPPTDADVLAAATRAAANRGLSLDAYIRYVAAGSGMVIDPIGGQAFTPTAYASDYQSRIGATYGYTGSGMLSFGALAGMSTVPGGVSAEARAAAMRPNGAPMEFDPSAINARAGGVPSGGGSGLLIDAAATADKATEALRREYGAYTDLITGMNGAEGAAAAFKVTQDGLLEHEQVYSQQISEFSSQVNAQDAAYGILNQRREDGIKLTADETRFLDNYAKANERGTGAVEDATIAQGMLAQAYLLNMGKGDQINQSLQDQTASTSDLVDIIRDLILMMDGVPEDVRTRLTIEGAGDAEARLSAIVAHLNGLDGRQTTYYINEVRTGISIGSPSGVGPTPEMANGGTVYGPLMPSFANGGTYALVGEVGPEIVRLSRGDQVTPTGASRSMMRRGGDQFHFNAPVTVVAPDPQAFANAAREQSVGSSRI